ERKDLDFEHRLLMPDGSIKYVKVVSLAWKEDWVRVAAICRGDHRYHRAQARGRSPAARRSLSIGSAKAEPHGQLGSDPSDWRIYLLFRGSVPHSGFRSRRAAAAICRIAAALSSG